MATKSVKDHNGTEGNEELESIFEDRISDLPDEIIIHILSFLPTIVAVRMSILSKQWRRMWTSIRVLNFCDSRDVAYFRRPCSEKFYYEWELKPMFLNFVDECLEQPYADTKITKFQLKMESYGCCHRLDGWLRFPVKKNVQELVLQVNPTCCTYSLPSLILCLRTLTLLELNGLELKVPVASLPVLKILYLEKIITKDQALNTLLLGCPSLEKLRLHNCYGLVNPHVFSLSLEYMEYYGGERSSCKSIKVEATNLHSFMYKELGGNCKINLVRCWAIRSLSFSDSITDQWLEDLIPQLPLLESLDLKTCYGLKHIKIRNQHLKDLVINCKFYQMDSLQATIDTPSLVSFSYTGYSVVKLSVKAPNLLYAYIRICGSLDQKTYDIEWYTNLINFLSELNGTKNVHIFCCTKKALTIPKELREIHPSPMPDLKNLKVKIGLQLFKEVMFRKSLLWISPSLETLAVDSGGLSFSPW